MSLDWIKCIICQESTKEALKCPLNSNGSPEANQQTYLAFLPAQLSFATGQRIFSIVVSLSGSKDQMSQGDD